MPLDVLPTGNGRLVGVADEPVFVKASLELGVTISVSEVDIDVLAELVPELEGNGVIPTSSEIMEASRLSIVDQRSPRSIDLGTHEMGLKNLRGRVLNVVSCWAVVLSLSVET